MVRKEAKKVISDAKLNAIWNLHEKLNIKEGLRYINYHGQDKKRRDLCNIKYIESEDHRYGGLSLKKDRRTSFITI